MGKRRDRLDILTGAAASLLVVLIAVAASGVAYVVEERVIAGLGHLGWDVVLKTRGQQERGEPEGEGQTGATVPKPPVLYPSAQTQGGYGFAGIMQPGANPPARLILTLTDPTIEYVETVWRPRLGENEYPRILGFDVDNILVTLTLEFGGSPGWYTLIDRERIDLVRLMKWMRENQYEVDPGLYDRVRMRIENVQIITREGTVLEPNLEQDVVEFPIYLDLAHGDQHELRLDIDAAASLRFTLENGLVWDTRARVAHRALDVAEWEEVVENNVPESLLLEVGCSKRYAVVGEPVSFWFEPAENVMEVSWDFDDGENSTQLAPTHAFAQPGGYRVRVQARYEDNTVREGRVALAVTHPAPAVALQDVPPPVSPGVEAGVAQFTGQPSARVPLDLPPGRGVEPSLALVYGAGQQNGLLGVGWTLAGLGSIERDAREGVPRYDFSDRFLLSMEDLNQELVSLGDPKHPPQEFSWRVTGTGVERVRESGTLYPEIPFEWNVHAQGIEHGMWREEFPDVPFNWTVEGRATETWQGKVCHVDPEQTVSITVKAMKTEEWSSDYVSHGGSDWIVSSGTISGVHVGVNTFKVPSGCTVYVGGSLEVHARNIQIEGTLSASGRGYSGATTEAGSGSGPGAGSGYWGDHGYGWGGGGAGYGGQGGYGNGIPGNGGRGSPYDQAGLVSWPPSSDDVWMGSGGGAGTAAQGGFSAVGGNGGGKIILIAEESISISGNVQANGSDGAYGNDRGEGGGGGGSGGGILLWGNTVNVTGSIEAKGGGGGNSYESGGGGGGAGGRVKIFYRTSAQVGSVNVSGGIGGYRAIWGRGTWADGGTGETGTYHLQQLESWTEVYQTTITVNLLDIYNNPLDLGSLSALLPSGWLPSSTSKFEYEVSSSNSNVRLYFSDTSCERTKNSNAHMMVEPADGVITIKNSTEVENSASGYGTVNKLENWKTVGAFSITLSSQHGGELSDMLYRVSDNESNVDTRLIDVQVENIFETVYPSQNFTCIVSGSAIDPIVRESYTSKSRTLWNRYVSDTSESGSLANTYDEDFDTYYQYYVHHAGDGTVEGSITADYLWLKPRHVDSVLAKMWVHDHEGNYQGFRHEYRVYLQINGNWTQIDYGAWAYRSEGGRPYSPEGPTSNITVQFQDHYHWSTYNRTLSSGWDNVTGVRVMVWGGAYSYEGDRQQQVWLRIYEVKVLAQDNSTDYVEGTVNALDGEKDLGGFVGLEGDSNLLSNETYTVSCDNPNVQVYFSDTGSTTTSNRNAHVIARTDYSEVVTSGFVISGTVQAKTDYYEFRWYPDDFTAVENDSSGSATVSALSDNDLGSVLPLLVPQHGGTMENLVYTASCDDPRVVLRFSDTGTSQTSNPDARLIASTSFTVSTAGIENEFQVSASYSGTGSVSESDGEVDLGGFDATPAPQHGGSVEDVVYTVVCDNPRVQVYFSDTGTAQTSNPRARVLARTDYRESALVAEYRPRGSSNIRVRFNGDYWELWEPSGLRYTFGSSPGSRMSSARGTFRWLLDRVTDTHGNYMRISYTQDGGYAYPASIEYTGHEGTGEPPWVRITFVYESRPDPIISYRAGLWTVMSKRLARIEISVEGGLVRTYELGYSISPSTQRSLLTSVTERAGTGEALPPVTFEYTEGTWAFGGETTEENFLCERVRNGDFDQGLSNWSLSSSGVDCSVEKNHLKFSTFHQGGGRKGAGHSWGAELSQSLGYLEAGMKAELTYAGYLYQRTEEGSGGVDQSVILVKPDGSQVTLDSRSIPHSDDADWDEQYSVSKDISSHITQSGEYRLIIRLANGWCWGDRGGGWCYIQAGLFFVSVEAWQSGSFRVSAGRSLLRADFDGDGLADLLTLTLDGDWLVRAGGRVSSWLRYTPSFSDRVLFGDFNGDGLADAALYSDQTALRIAFSTGSSFQAPVVWSTGLSGSGKLQAGDFDGDGRADVMAVGPDGLSVSLSAGDRFSAAGAWLTGVSTSGLEILTADFNGDGLEDVALVDSSSGTWRVALSTGSGFTAPAVWASGLSPGAEVAAMDLNRDGLADAAVLDSGSLMFAPSTGAGFGSIRTFASGLERMPSLADFNGDGLPDLSVFSPDSGLHRVTLATGGPADMLSRVRSRLGGTVSYTYAPSTTCQNTRLPVVMQVVSGLTENSGLSEIRKEYRYSGGRFSRDQGFAGFGEVSVTTSAGAVQITHFHQDRDRAGLVYETEVRDSDGRVYQRTHVTWEVVRPAPGMAVPLVTQEETYTYDGDSTYRLRAVSYEYDDYGNITASINYGDVAVQGDERTDRTEYVYNLQRWLMVPARVRTLDAGGSVVREVWNYYDRSTSLSSAPVRGDLTRRVIWNGGEKVVEELTYDVYGNLVRIRDSRGNSTRVEYDSQHHLFQIRIINPMGYVQERAYDPATGACLSESDFNGSITRHVYDKFGRLVEVYLPGENAPALRYEYDAAVAPVRTIVRVRSFSGTDVWSTAYAFFDGSGNLIELKSPAGTEGRQIVSFASLVENGGSVVKQWLPYEVDESPEYTTPDPAQPKEVHCFDVMGRELLRLAPTGGTFRWIYSDWSITIIDPDNNRRQTVYDAYGRAVEIREFNGGEVYVTKYSYDALGNLTRIVDALGNVTVLEYDALGRRTRVVDPDMGEWLYRYDAGGNMTHQRNARGEWITYQYDALNRLTEKVYPDGSRVEYGYDDPGVPYSIGRRTSVVDASGRTASYYDECGREIRTVRTVDGVVYTVERQFDLQDRMVSITYPDGERVWYAYDRAGRVVGVVGDQVYVKRVEWSPSGQPVRVEYGNGVSTVYGYDSAGRLSSVQVGGGSYLSKTYEYSQAGLLAAVNDQLRGTSQTFAYDGLARLIRAEGPYGVYTYSYDALGNLIEKDGINYQYGQGGSKPHAVTAGSDGFAAVYDQNGNMVWRRDHNGQTTYTYDYEDRLVEVERNGSLIAQYVYDGGGGRVKKVTPQITRIYIGSLYEVDNLGRTTKHIFLGAQRIATVENGSVSFYHSDQVGSASLITDGRGNLVQFIEYDPFGGVAVTSGSENVRYRFMGKESDDETGLVYCGARYYDPVLGRFVTPDPLVQSLDDPQLLNRYAFCRNNPLVFWEVQGNWFLALVFFVCVAITVASFVSPSFNAWMHETFGGFAAPLQTAAMVVATFVISGPGLGSGSTFAATMKAAAVSATAAAAATALLDTGEGRKFIRWLANEVFDDVFGMSPKIAYVAANVVAHIAASWTFEKAFAKLTGQAATLEEKTREELERVQKEGGSSPVGEGSKGLVGKNYGSPTGKVDLRGYDRIYAIMKNGKMVGILASRPLGIPFLPFARHWQVWMMGYQGFTLSGWSYSILFIGPLWGTCQQAANLGLLLSGLSTTIPMGLDVFFTTLVHGNYGGGFLTRVYWAQRASNG